MRIGKWAWLLLAATPFLSGCKGFWDAPSGGSSFSLSNSGNITVSAGATGTSTITVTPANSFTGTVALTCAVTTSISNATSPTTCSLSPTSVTISDTTAQTSALSAITTATTTAGAYQIKVTGVSGSEAETTSFCVAVGTSSSSCSTAGSSGNFYILNTTSVTGYSITAGALTVISGSSSTVTSASAIAIDPTGSFLYVASAAGITIYSIDSSTGALTQGSVVYGDPVSNALQVDPTGNWLLDASLTGTLYAIPITSTGTEDTTRTVQTVSLAGPTVEPGGMAISPSGFSNASIISVALGSTGTQTLPFTTGSDTPIGAAYTPTVPPYNNSGGAALSVAIDPQNRLMYVGETGAFPSSNTDSGALRVFTINASSLTEFTYANKIPYASGGLSPHAILPISTGKYVYVANGEGTAAGNITGFAVTTTALTLGSTAAAGVTPLGLAEDSTNSYVFEVGSAGRPYFDAYTFDTTTPGQLDSKVTSTAQASSIAIVATPQ